MVVHLQYSYGIKLYLLAALFRAEFVYFNMNALFHTLSENLFRIVTARDIHYRWIAQIEFFYQSKSGPVAPVLSDLLKIHVILK